MFVLLTLLVALAVALTILMAMPRRLRSETESTTAGFGDAADQLRPAVLRIDDAGHRARARRLDTEH